MRKLESQEPRGFPPQTRCLRGKQQELPSCPLVSWVLTGTQGGRTGRRLNKSSCCADLQAARESHRAQDPCRPPRVWHALGVLRPMTFLTSPPPSSHYLGTQEVRSKASRNFQFSTENFSSPWNPSPPPRPPIRWAPYPPLKPRLTAPCPEPSPASPLHLEPQAGSATSPAGRRGLARCREAGIVLSGAQGFCVNSSFFLLIPKS